MPGKMIVVAGPLPPPVHGAALITKRAADTLRAAGFQLAFGDTSPGNAPNRWRHHFNRARAYARCGRAIIRHSEAPTLYLSLSGGYGLLYDLLMVALARWLGKTIAFHHHSFAYLTKRSPILASIVRMAGTNQLHITLCPRMATTLSELYGKHLRTVVISNLAFIDLPAVELRNCGRKFSSIGYLSNISLEKGIDRFLDLMARLRESGSSLTARIAGPCSDLEIERYIKRRASEIGGIEYVGPVYDDAKVHFLSSIDALIFPTRYVNEAQPVVIYEAQMAGIIVAASSRGCIANMVPEELLLDPSASDLDGIAKQILAWEKSVADFQTALNEADRNRAGLLVQREDDARKFVDLFEVPAIR
ncbi:glycosyltransferase family 4 protein [Bradyrhizobium sp. RP6]|uniref:glycosyltransferase family 4 protein n=1 Tax=Bradyrhizobium sp. RP6 TaxID=2489596 RepID=UPI000F5428CB|nr:glycosyltransferase family 4 protein [Bradyrhizobium sp. RP6]RQH11524.1 glycosyltransferase [Bradyrhizobium sp. RP6]